MSYLSLSDPSRAVSVKKTLPKKCRFDFMVKKWYLHVHHGILGGTVAVLFLALRKIPNIKGGKKHLAYFERERYMDA